MDAGAFYLFGLVTGLLMGLMLGMVVGDVDEGDGRDGRS